MYGVCRNYNVCEVIATEEYLTFIVVSSKREARRSDLLVLGIIGTTVGTATVVFFCPSEWPPDGLWLCY